MLRIGVGAALLLVAVSIYVLLYISTLIASGTTVFTNDCAAADQLFQRTPVRAAPRRHLAPFIARASIPMRGVPQLRAAAALHFRSVSFLPPPASRPLKPSAPSVKRTRS